MNVISKIIVFLTALVNLQAQDIPWEILQTPTDKTLKNLYFVNESTGWAGGEGGTIVSTIDSGNTWAIQNSTVTTFIVDIFFLNENLGWALTQRNVPPFGTTILKTTNGGDNWIANDFPEDNVFMNTILFFDSLNGWIGGTYIAGTTDGGESWVEADVDSNLISSLPVYNLSFYTRQFGYACGGFIDFAGVIWKTTNFGQNWSAQGVSPDEIFDLYVFDSLNAVTLSGDPEGFFGIGKIKTTDAGINWSYDSLSIYGLSFTIDFRTEPEGWSASGFKFLFTSDKGKSWINKETPDSTVVFDLQFINSQTGFASGENGVVLKYIPDPNSIEEKTDFNEPDEFILYQNYPNPFNPTTNIRFQVSDFGFVSLKIYDILGNTVATLVNEEKPTGEYEVNFSSKLNYQIQSGVYFYQLIAGGFVQTKKMVLLK
jgi:photosystem II stability/assembly factor-like uncharacterized protein